MVKALVTGGAGFIGSNLVISLVEKGYQVTVVDDLSMGVKANLATVADQIEFHEHDVCDHEFMHSILDEDFDYIYYLAAIASVADSVTALQNAPGEPRISGRYVGIPTGKGISTKEIPVYLLCSGIRELSGITEARRQPSAAINTIRSR